MVPLFAFDASLTWPETLGDRKHNMLRTIDGNGLSAITMAVAHIAAGNSLSGDRIYEQILDYLQEDNVPPDRVVSWARCLIQDPNSMADMDAVPAINETKGFSLHPYQRENAAWAANRLGSILAHGCGVGKTATAIAAAIAAVRIKKCSDSRCFIVAPVNAEAVWLAVRPELKRYFKDVQVVSIDSTHNLTTLDTAPGGALIIDEAHKAKGGRKADGTDTRRTASLLRLRRCFEWATTLSGSVFESGPEGLMNLHNIACPGLARFTDKMMFGKAFLCIAKKQIGRRQVRSLVLPSLEGRKLMVPYCYRSTRSLSFTSPSVASVVQLKTHRDIVEDVWPRPAWAASGLWLPEIAWATYFGAMSVCIMRDDRLALLKCAAEHSIMAPVLDSKVELAPDSADPDGAQPIDWKVLKERIGTLANDPFYPVDKIKPLRALLKLGGLPTFSRVYHQIIREGRIARCIAPCTTPAGPSFQWLYPPPEESQFGPKLLYIRQWLTDHPGQKLVVAAGGRLTLRLAEELLTADGVSFRTIHGGVDGATRGEYVEAFQSSDVRVMLVQQVAGSESIQLTAAATSMLVDLDNKPVAYTQFIHRVYRQGQTEETEHIDMIFGSVQARLLSNIQNGRGFDQTLRSDLEAEVRNAGYSVL